MEVKTKEGAHIAGRVTINTFRAGMVEAATPYLDLIRECRKELNGDFSPAYKAHVRERIARQKHNLDDIRAAHFIRKAVEVSNLVVDSPNYGLDLIIQRLVGNNTYSLNILWIEIGTGTTTPTVNDTALTTPSLRLPVSFQEDYGATDAIVQAYVTDGNLPNGTYNEVGSFVDGSASTGSGQMFNHALISPAFSKSSGIDVTVEINFTMVNS
jgi:hypothetical protein